MIQRGSKQPGVMQKDLSALLFGSVPKPARTACWSLFFWGILMCLIAFPLLGDAVTNANPKMHELRRVVFLAFTGYVGIAAVSSAFLLWLRKPWARVLAWTAMPLTLLCIPAGTWIGIRAIVAMHSREMSAYLHPAPPRGFDVQIAGTSSAASGHDA
jgi:hypothetical protein